MTWRKRAQRSYDMHQFLALAAPAASFITMMLIIGYRHPTKLILVAGGVSLVLIWLRSVAKSRTKKYQQLAQLSNIARGSMGRPGYKQRDYDQIASWMSEGD